MLRTMVEVGPNSGFVAVEKRASWSIETDVAEYFQAF